jgi:phosphatidylserine/phosphatidylglycerophosphate/cardiolipin synthase-like enzyme
VTRALGEPDLDFVSEPRLLRTRIVAGRGHYESVVRAVIDAKVSVWIATANLKELLVEDARMRMPGRPRSFRSVLAVFDDLAERGLDLRILHAGFPSQAFRDAFDSHPRLVAGALQMRQCPRVHLKAVIVDGGLLYLGSANWTGAGLGAKSDRNRNFELGLVTEDEALLDQVQAIFDHLWRGGECARCGRREACEAPLDLEAATPLPPAGGAGGNRAPRATAAAARRRR